MVRIEGANKTFNPNSGTEVKALIKVSLDIADLDFVVLIGSNGSGKSTLLNLISGGVLMDSGEIYLENIKVTQFPEYARSKWISHIFQNPMAGTASELSILDNFRLASIRTQNKGLHFGNSVSFRQKVKETISFLGMGLENKLNQFMGNLSGGQRQALTLAMAIMDNAKVLLLDEPTAALDVKSAQIVMETAAKISKDFSLTTILVTHNLRDVVEYGNRVIQLSKGKIIRDIDKSALPELKLSEVYAWMDAVEAGE